MAIHQPIRHFFDGRAYPAAKIIEGTRRQIYAANSSIWTPNAPTSVAVETTGKGRKWTTDTPQSFWRSFVEIDREDDAAVIAWVARRGDPSSQLRPGQPVQTEHWTTLAAILKPLARCWTDDPANRHALSKIDPERYANGTDFIRELHEPFTAGFLAPDERHGIAYRYSTLGDFMIGSAIDNWRNRIKMRRCDVCDSWFEVRRETAGMCSQACSIQRHYKKRGR